MNLNCMQYPVYLGNLEQNKQLFLKELSSRTVDSDGIYILPEMWATGFDYKNIGELAKQTPQICAEIQQHLKSDSLVISLF